MLIERNRLLAFFCCCLVNVASEAAQPASRPFEPDRGGLRLDGTFIQYQPWMMKLDAQAWARELESMHRAHLRTVVIQWLARNDQSLIPAAQATDPTQIILDFADAHDMQVFVGLAMDDQWWNWQGGSAVPERLTTMTRRTAEQAWERYGKHRSFAGWYIPPEPADTLAAESVAPLKAFFRETSEVCRRLAGGKPLAFAPFLTGQIDPDLMRRRYTNLLTGSGVDIVMLQDGVGARRWDDTVHGNVVPLFRAMRDACLAAGAELWSDVEIFRDTSRDPARPAFVPADTARLGRQLTAEAPFVSRFIAFDCFHYMSPHRGETQRLFYEAYLTEFVDRPFHPVFGPSVIVDPSFGYYLDRSPESIAAEIRANGYSVIRIIVEPSVRVNAKLVEAFHRAGIGVWLQVFGNGTYSKQFLPPEWPAWKMITRTDLAGGSLQGFQRLCLNNAGYREWKKRDLANALRLAPFDGIEIAESHWPEYPGIESPAYACFCDACRDAFTRMFPDEPQLPDVLDANSPRSPARNPALWAKWLQFRQASLTAFLDDMVNGPGGLRQTSPGRRVTIWGLGLSEADGVRRVREDSGQDAGEAAAKVKPDLYCFQTHWPDWMRKDLSPDYVKAYVPFIEQLREHAPDLPLMIQADIGSTREAIRDRDWIEDFQRASHSIGAESTCLYEYFIGGWSYHEPPRAATARWVGDRIEIGFTRRIDPASARRPEAFTINGQPVEGVRVDGSLAFLPASGRSGEQIRVDIHGLTDDKNRRLFKEFSPSLERSQTIWLPKLF